MGVRGLLANKLFGKWSDFVALSIARIGGLGPTELLSFRADIHDTRLFEE